MNRSAMKSLLQKIDGYDFEHLIADLWTEQGWKTRVLPASNDRGIDVEARRSEPFEQKHLIQAKRYSASNKVGSEMIQQYASLQYQEENVDAVLIITTSSFTKPAKEIAADLNIKLINGDDLTKIIKKRDAGDIVNDYTSSESNKDNSQEPTQNTTDNFLQTLSYPKATDGYISKLVDNSVGETVTKESLTKTSGDFWSGTKFETPVLLYLFQNEQPHFILECEKIRFPDQKLLDPSNGACLVATNNRIFVIIGNNPHDMGFEISYRDIIDTTEFGILRTKIKIEVNIGLYKFIITGTQATQETDYCVRCIKNVVHSVVE